MILESPTEFETAKAFCRTNDGRLYHREYVSQGGVKIEVEDDVTEVFLQLDNKDSGYTWTAEASWLLL